MRDYLGHLVAQHFGTVVASVYPRVPSLFEPPVPALSRRSPRFPLARWPRAGLDDLAGTTAFPHHPPPVPEPAGSALRQPDRFAPVSSELRESPVSPGGDGAIIAATRTPSPLVEHKPGDPAGPMLIAVSRQGENAADPPRRRAPPAATEAGLARARGESTIAVEAPVPVDAAPGPSVPEDRAAASAMAQETARDPQSPRLLSPGLGDEDLSPSPPPDGLPHRLPRRLVRRQPPHDDGAPDLSTPPTGWSALSGSAPPRGAQVRATMRSEVPAAVASEPSADAPPTVQIVIGRVSVQALAPRAPEPRAARVAPAPRLSLEEYLRQREGRP